MLQFEMTLDGVRCTVSWADMPSGVSWRARIVRRGSVTREVTGFIPSVCVSSPETRPLVESAVRDAVAWIHGRLSPRS